MYQIDVSSVASTRPNSSALGAVGYFTDGNAATGVAATVVPAEFLNSVMLEIMGAITGAGLTLSKSSFTQLYTAIQTIAQGGGTTYAADTGAANAYKATYTPTVAAPADGMVRALKVKTVNTGASTFALDGSATTYPIYGLGGTALTGGELAANGIAVLRYNSTLAGWVLFHCSGGAQQLPSGSYGVTPPQFDATAKLATMAAVRTAGQQYSQWLQITVASTLPPSVCGAAVQLPNPSTPQVLPLASACPSGSVIFIHNTSATVNTVSRQGTDQIYVGSTPVTSISLGAGADNIALVSNGGSVWYAASGTAELAYASGFVASLAANGYQKLPSGLIIQWGSATTSGGTASLVFPIAFPTACRSITATESGAAGWSSTNATFYGTANANATGCTVRSATMSSSAGISYGNGNYFWIATGY